MKTRDESLCTCKQVDGEFTDLSKHELRCPYRLKYDNVEVSVAFSEKELLEINYVFLSIGRSAALREMFMSTESSLATIEEKLRNALTMFAKLRIGDPSVEVKQGG